MYKNTAFPLDWLINKKEEKFDVNITGSGSVAKNLLLENSLSKTKKYKTKIEYKLYTKVLDIKVFRIFGTCSIPWEPV